MKPSEVLRSARAKIEKPGNWTQGTWARTADRLNIVPEDLAACSFCLMGAVRNVTRRATDTFFRAIEYLREALPRGEVGIHSFNDKRTHAEVLALFDRAIAAAEARGE